MGHDDVARRLQERMEQESVRTTIVGGRPPGSGQAVGAVPRGVEVLLKKAAVDAAFRVELIEKRAGAAERLGLSLTVGEKMMLRAVSGEQLGRMIGQTKVPEAAVGALMGQAAAVMLAALGLMQLGGCITLGHQADMPAENRGAASNTQSDPASQTGPGLTKTGSAGVTVSGPSTTSTAPASEPLSRGVRPDVPPLLTKGIRPDVPGGEAVSRGVRPDVPPTKPAPTQPAPTEPAPTQPATQSGPVMIQLTGRNTFSAGVTVGGEGGGVRVDATQSQPASQTKPATQPSQTLILTPQQTYTGRVIVSAGVLVMSPEGAASQTQPATQTRPVSPKERPPSDMRVMRGVIADIPAATAPGTQSQPASQTRPATKPAEVPEAPKAMAGVRVRD